MRIGFTGTQHLHRLNHVRVAEFIDEYGRDGVEFTSGACIGVDTFAAVHCIIKAPRMNHRLIVPSNRSKIDTSLFELFAEEHRPGWRTIEFMGSETSYMDRNQRILDHTDRLLVIAEYPEKHGKSKRSGTWATYRRAVQRGIETRVMILEEDA